jgi:hypothetical protein
LAAAFAGPLSRFFAASGDDPARLRAGVEAWCSDLRRSVAAKVADELAWDEAADVAFASELGDAGWTALRLLAFYAERSELEWPDTVPLLCELDPEWRRAADQGFATSLYGQLLACETWLPGEFPVTLKAPRPDGETVEMGSVVVLHDQLRWLNQRTFQADADEIARWIAELAPAGSAFLPAAKRGYAGLWAAAEVARRERVPLVVHST